MITLFSTIIGFFGAAFPDLLKYFHDRDDRAQELAIMDRQIELQKQGFSQRLQEIEVQANVAESQAIYKTWRAGIKWVDALNASVRPVLAYAFFLLYALTKFLQFALLDALSLQSIALLWQEEDQAIFAGIISFYFGQRAMSKLRK